MATTRLVMQPTQKILLKRKLNRNGAAQVFFTKECAKEFNNYVPFLTGRLKDVMITIYGYDLERDFPLCGKPAF